MRSGILIASGDWIRKSCGGVTVPNPLLTAGLKLNVICGPFAVCEVRTEGAVAGVAWLGWPGYWSSCAFAVMRPRPGLLMVTVAEDCVVTVQGSLVRNATSVPGTASGLCEIVPNGRMMKPESDRA